jgi:hypothetical protein
MIPHNYSRVNVFMLAASVNNARILCISNHAFIIITNSQNFRGNIDPGLHSGAFRGIRSFGQAVFRPSVVELVLGCFLLSLRFIVDDVLGLREATADSRT